MEHQMDHRMEHGAEREIDVDLLAALMPGDPIVVDVREPEEYAAAHLAGTRLIPMDALAEHLHDLAHEAAQESEPVYLICRSGNRSGLASRSLAAIGIDAVNVRGGIEAWMASGRPVEGGAR